MGGIGVFGLIIGTIMILASSIEGFLGEKTFWWDGGGQIGIFVFGIIITVVGIALAIIAYVKPSNEQSSAELSVGLRKCPFCANDIKKEAIVCQYCGKDVPK